MSFKEQYIKLLADHITVSVEDLSSNELAIMNKSYDLWKEKMDDLKILGDENKRIAIQLANLQSSLDDADYHHDDEFHDPHDEDSDTDIDNK